VRGYLLIISLLTLGGLVCASGCQTAPDTITIVHPPEDATHHFTTASRKLPPARSGYPLTINGTAWGSATPVPVSGYDFMQRFTPGTLVSSAVVCNRFTIAGIRTRTIAERCDTAVPFTAAVLEYFKAPNDDVHSKFFGADCRVHEERRGVASYLVLPGTPPAFPAGQNAALLDATYLGSLTPAQRRAIDTSPALFERGVQW
jgi:hypothetical protein